MERNLPITRQQVAARTLTARCPNCGYFAVFKNWFRLHKNCPDCEMELEKEESGFYFGTTSIGYVLAILFVILPVCFLVVLGRLTMWGGITVGILGSVLLCTLTYPLLLCWVLTVYYTVQAEELPANQDKSSMAPSK